MLVLFNSQNDQIHTFKTYDALYSHLENRERARRRPKRIFACHFEQGLEKALQQAAGTHGDGEGASHLADLAQPERTGGWNGEAH